jgi:omega-6 fatty acid desaturase (delta-12 desaturase)
MIYSLNYGYWVTLLFAVPTAGFLVRLFIIQHDCGHGAFFPSRTANNTLGFLLGVVTLTPYTYWRKTHAIHHATAGNLDRRGWGDITTLTVKEYLALPKHRQLAYRLYRHPGLMFLVGPAFQFIVKHRFPWDLPSRQKRAWRSVHLTNLILVLLVSLFSLTIGLPRLLLVQLPVTLIASVIGVWLFYIQHQFEPTYWQHHNHWQFHRAGLQGSSYYDLPAVLRWFTANIGLHHIHHLNSQIPSYKLQQCFNDTPPLQNVTRLTLWRSLRCASLKLWDEGQQKLVGFQRLP